MAAKRSLRVATEADAKPTKPKSLAETVAEGGSYVDILRAQRLEMIRDVRDEKGPARAALHRQIALHSKEIAAIEANDDDQETSEGAEVEDGDFDASAV